MDETGMTENSLKRDKTKKECPTFMKTDISDQPVQYENIVVNL